MRIYAGLANFLDPGGCRWPMSVFIPDTGDLILTSKEQLSSCKEDVFSSFGELKSVSVVLIAWHSCQFVKQHQKSLQETF